MASIRSAGTGIEKIVFRELRKKKVYFKKHYRKAPGNPDIALPRQKKAVFIDGDFWHGHKFLKLKKRLPKGYWPGKIERNITRDRGNRAALKRAGWLVLRIWEHEILKDPDAATGRVEKFLKK